MSVPEHIQGPIDSASAISMVRFVFPKPHLSDPEVKVQEEIKAEIDSQETGPLAAEASSGPMPSESTPRTEEITFALVGVSEIPAE